MGGCVSSPEAPTRGDGHRRTHSAPAAIGKAYYADSRGYYRAPPPQYSHSVRMRQTTRPFPQPVIQSVPPAYDSYRSSSSGRRKWAPTAYRPSPPAVYYRATSPVASPKRVGFGVVEVREYRTH